MIRAIARIEASAGSRAATFRILACPSAREYAGAALCATGDAHSRIGEYVVVEFAPGDMFAYECSEVLQESAESRVARGLHPGLGPHCVKCSTRLTEAEVAVQRPDYDEVCAACGGPSTGTSDT